MEMLIIDNVKYYACTDIAKKISLKNGMEVVNKYSEYSIKKYGKWWIKASVFQSAPKEAKFSFREITPFSANKMNKAVIIDGKPALVNSDEYKEFRRDMRKRVYEAFKSNKNIMKDICFSKPLELIITTYSKPIYSNGTLYIRDCSNPTKPLEDILYEAISEIVKLCKFDDKLNIKVVTSIVDVKNKKEEGYDIIIKNAKSYSSFTEELRCRDIKTELALR